jgi:hypothetical protein
MAGKRASIFEEDEPAELDVSGFAPKSAPESAPPPEAVREVSEAAKFPSREPARRTAAPPPTPPRREPRRYRTGRNVQFNAKVSQETVDTIYAIADRQGWVLGETLEHALAALRRELAREGQGTS